MAVRHARNGAVFAVVVTLTFVACDPRYPTCLDATCDPGVTLRVWSDTGPAFDVTSDNQITTGPGRDNAAAFDVTDPADRATFDREWAAKEPITLPTLARSGSAGCGSDISLPDSAVGRTIAVIAVGLNYDNCPLLGSCVPMSIGTGRAFVQVHSGCQPLLVPLPNATGSPLPTGAGP
jgi:hypothetical protein